MSIPNGTYQLLSVAANLPLKPSSDAPNSLIIAATDDSSDSFKWQLTVQSGNVYTITNIKNSMFAFVGTNIVAPPANVVVATVSQQFTISPVAGSPGVFTIQTLDTGVYWSLNSTNPTSYVDVSKTGTANLQQFKIVGFNQPLETGTYTITNVATNLPLKPQSPAANSNIIATTTDHSDNFKWTLNKIANNIFTISNRGNGLFAYAGNNMQPGSQILTSTSQQQYRVELIPSTTDTYSIATLDSGIYWGLRSATPGAVVTTGATNTSQLYQFFIKKA
jgi:hypothetical protein